MSRFLTSDGYTLHRWADGKWRDAPEGGAYDLTFAAHEESGMPSYAGIVLEGELINDNQA